MIKLIIYENKAHMIGITILMIYIKILKFLIKLLIIKIFQKKSKF